MIWHQISSRTQDGAIALDHERTIDQRVFLHRLAQAGVEHIPKLFRIAVKRVQNQLLGIAQDVSSIPHDEHRANGMRFASFGGDFHGQRKNAQHHCRADDVDAATILFRKHRAEMRFRFRDCDTVEPSSVRACHADDAGPFKKQVLRRSQQLSQVGASIRESSSPRKRACRAFDENRRYVRW